jgi:hypothetical protein
LVAAIGVDALDEREGTAGLPQYGSGTVAVLNIVGMNDDAQQEAQGIDEDMTLASLLVLVDELAHSNAPGTRNPKRYLDVEELLAAGIDVYTTLNIQHVDSLNDVVAPDHLDPCARDRARQHSRSRRRHRGRRSGARRASMPLACTASAALPGRS